MTYDKSCRTLDLAILVVLTEYFRLALFHFGRMVCNFQPNMFWKPFGFEALNNRHGTDLRWQGFRADGEHRITHIDHFKATWRDLPRPVVTHWGLDPYYLQFQPMQVLQELLVPRQSRRRRLPAARQTQADALRHQEDAGPQGGDSIDSGHFWGHFSGHFMDHFLLYFCPLKKGSSDNQNWNFIHVYF